MGATELWIERNVTATEFQYAVGSDFIICIVAFWEKKINLYVMKFVALKLFKNKLFVKILLYIFTSFNL